MKSEMETVKRFLHEQLKRIDVSQLYKDSIKSTLDFINAEMDKTKSEWNSFVQTINEKVPDWNNFYPIDGFEYILSVRQHEQFFTMSLDLGSQTYSTWVFEIRMFNDLEKSMIFSSIQDDCDEIEYSSFEELENAIEQVFVSEEFAKNLATIKTMVQEGRL